MQPDPLPAAARRAFATYPEIEPSTAFNRAVLDALAAAQRQHQATLIGRLEEFLGLSWWQFAASGILGALLPALVTGALLWSYRGAVPTQPVPANLPFPRSIGPLYARELWREIEPQSAPRPSAPQVAPRPSAPASGAEFSCVAFKFRSV